MSSNIAIVVEDLGKCYQLYDKPQDRLLQMLCRGKKTFYREFWALKDVSFQVRKGETLGIIGRNGSGKSTLLQIICGTLNPNSGNIQTNGKVAALLELGSGFNPEFTGRENVYLNAALYGLTREQTNQRFDDIAAFADIGEFIDQPVKTYSSGMYVRLAFAVAAHVDADILVIDEALAVGDAIFTQKCMRFIRNFREKGTLIFVSHDLAAVQNLCETAVWLRNGKVALMSDSQSVVESYTQFSYQEISEDEVKYKTIKREPKSNVAKREMIFNYDSKATIVDNIDFAGGWETGGAEIQSVELLREENSTDDVFHGGETVHMKITARAIKEMNSPIVGFLVRDRLGQDLFGENTLSFTNSRGFPVKAGQTLYAEFVFQLPMLPNGQYVVMASVANGTLQDHVQHHWLHDALIINVCSSKVRWGLVGVPFEKVSLQCH